MHELDNEYLKINHQDGLIYFEDFRVADVLLIKKNANTYRFDVDIKTFDGPYSKKERLDIEHRIGQSLYNEYSFAWLSIENHEVEMSTTEELENLTIEIEKGWDDETENGLVSIYLGWGIELLNNKIKFEKIENDFYIIWKANSGDIDYYDERARQTSYEMSVKVMENHSIIVYFHLWGITPHLQILQNLLILQCSG